MSGSGGPASGQRHSRLLAHAGLLPVLVLQVALVVQAAPPAAELAARPIRNVDYGAHYYQAVHGGEHLRLAGAFWGYDPFWMAGYPEGVISLIDNRLFLVLFLLVPEPTRALAFNAAILLALLSAPAALYVAARVAGASARQSSLAALGATAVTFTVPLSSFLWAGGAISFFLASFLAVPAALGLTLALDRSLFTLPGLLWTLLAVATVAIHPGIIPVLFAALLAPPVWSRRPRRRRLAELALVVSVLLLPLLPLVGVKWLLGRQMVPVMAGEFLQGGFSRLGGDWIGHLLRTEPGWAGGPGGLVALILLAVLGPASGPRESESLRMLAGRAVVVALVTCLFLAYGSSWSKTLWMIQPGRYLVPLAFFVCIPAGIGASRLLEGIAGRRLGAMLLGAVVATIVVEAGRGIGWTALGTGDDEAEDAIAILLAKNALADDRVLVESAWQQTPAYPGARARITVKRFSLLPLSLHRECLGYGGTGPITTERYTTFGDGWLFGSDLQRVSEGEVDRLLGRFAITWVVACRPRTLEVLERFPKLLEGAGTASDCSLLRVRNPQRSRLLAGEGRVEAGLDRIEVRDAAGASLVLKYHWLPTLRAIPPLRIEEAPQPGAPVGFISVHPEGVREFAIVQRSVPW